METKRVQSDFSQSFFKSIKNENNLLNDHLQFYLLQHVGPKPLH